MYTEKHLIELFNDHDFGNLAFSSVSKKKKFDRLYTILQKNGGTVTKPIWVRQNPSSCQTEKKKVFANSDFVRKALIDQCLILFLNYIIFIVFTPFIHFRFQPNTFVKTITTRLVICIYISQWHDIFHTTIDL